MRPHGIDKPSIADDVLIARLPDRVRPGDPAEGAKTAWRRALAERGFDRTRIRRIPGVLEFLRPGVLKGEPVVRDRGDAHFPVVVVELGAVAAEAPAHVVG